MESTFSAVLQPEGARHVKITVPPWLRRTGIEVLGWTLVALGFAALVLPGPGLLMLALGLLVLSLRYSWAKRLLIPVKNKAVKAATLGVQTWPRITLSVLAGLALIAIGITWGTQPEAPDWWPLGDVWWLPGGWSTAITLMASGLISLGLIAYSFKKYR